MKRLVIALETQRDLLVRIIDGVLVTLEPLQIELVTLIMCSLSVTLSGFLRIIASLEILISFRRQD